ncbi:MAG TPA: SWIM zinc finger family protein, partial [Actinophytocola sp.]|uniref:SWIM zinc finger family protein n=1 Tax=Actinophytocola sp. TaxID=1872138 RepID=UPI002DDD6DB5
ELRRWLADLVRRGLADAQRESWDFFDQPAARMVDAQAPGLASGLRRAGDVAGRGRDWPGRVLEELAQLHLLVSAHARLDELPAGLAATVRTRLGYTTEVADVVAAGERVADRWLVLGLVDQVDEWLTTRRVWLRGLETGRPALVLSFAAPGRQLDTSLVPGFAVPGELAFYPAAQPLRAVVAEREEAVAAGRPAGDPVDAALAGYAEALAADPWLERWPMLLGSVAPATVDGGWCLVDTDGDALPLRAGADPWPLLAVSGGGPVPVAGEWSRAGLLPLSCWDGERPVRL